MPTYRLLHRDEFEKLKQEFIVYLVSEGIDSEQWVRIQATDPDLRDHILASFSDMIIQQVLDSLRYVQLVSSKKLIFIHCMERGMRRVQLEWKDKQRDFLENDGQLLAEVSLHECEIFEGYKSYDYQGRDLALFRLLETGYSPSDGTYYKQIIMHLAALKEA